MLSEDWFDLLLNVFHPPPQLSTLECTLKLCIKLDSFLTKEYHSMALMPSSEVWRLMVPWVVHAAPRHQGTGQCLRLGITSWLLGLKT